MISITLRPPPPVIRCGVLVLSLAMFANYGRAYEHLEGDQEPDEFLFLP